VHVIMSQRKGFTLVELLVVIAIIGILARIIHQEIEGMMEPPRDLLRL
jgi:prepilin-type N-terminal cleavage/methylation domain-containing protein